MPSQVAKNLRQRGWDCTDALVDMTDALRARASGMPYPTKQSLHHAAASWFIARPVPVGERVTSGAGPGIEWRITRYVQECDPVFLGTTGRRPVREPHF